MSLYPKPAVRISSLPDVMEPAGGFDECLTCGEMVTFTTSNGQLLAMNATDRERHRHQPRAVSPTENRLRIAREREVT